MKRALLAAFVILWLPSAALAQETTGSIAGRVLDPQGAVVPEASVTLRSGQGATSLATDAHGRFFAPYLTPGQYTVRVELLGLQAARAEGRRRAPGPARGAGLHAQGGRLRGAGRGVGAAPVVDTRSTTAGGVLDSDELQAAAGRPPLDGHAVPGARRQQLQRHRRRQPVDRRRQRPRQPLRRGRRQHHEHGLRRRRLLLDRLRLAGHGRDHRLHPGDPGQDRRASRPSTARPRAASSTSSPRAAATRSTAPVRLLPPRPGWRAAGRQLQTAATARSTPPAPRTSTSASAWAARCVKDRLFFFGAFNPQYQTRTFDRARRASRCASLGEVDRKRRSSPTPGSSPGRLEPNHRFDLTAFGDPSHGELGPQRADCPARPGHGRASASSRATAATTRPCATTAS